MSTRAVWVLTLAVSAAGMTPVSAGAQTPAAAQPPPRTDAADTAELPGFVQDLRDRYDRLRARGITITLGSILPGSFLAAGIEARKDRFFGTPLGASIGGQWSMRGYQQYDLYAGRIKGRTHRAEIAPFDGDVASTFNDNSLLAFGTGVYVHVRERVYPRIDFFGLGQNATVEGRTDFGVSGASVDLVGQWQRDKHFGFSGRVGTTDVALQSPTNPDTPDTADIYTDATAPGLQVQRPYRVAGGSVTLDYRDDAGLPSRGMFAAVALWHASALDAGDQSSSWSRLTTDIRQFVPAFGPNQVLAVRLLLSGPFGTSGVPTPFYLQPTLGGSKTMRGFGSYRLRGDAVWAATAEYRWQVSPWIQAAPFLDVGAVADGWSTLRRTGPAVSAGAGIRATAEGRVFARIDVAGGRDGVRAVFTLSSPF